MSKDFLIEVAMKAVIIDSDGNALIVREKTYDGGSQAGLYGFPGGRVEPGEAWDDALRREVMEEAGVEVDILRPVYVGEWRPVIRGVTHQIIATFVVCRVKPGSKIFLGNEHDSYQWVDENTWRQYAYMNPDDKVLKTYLSLRESYLAK